ncbi:MAG TPA: hypothetical protein VKM72_07665 [Thermoanaerobaculia bacterium]|nr:hypothetical protein [Thermoanaerobaculia bacterium]
MNTKQNAVKELKADRVQEELAVEDAPLVIELKAERVQAPESVSREGQAAMPAVVQLTVNQKKRVVIDVWSMGLTITFNEPADGTVQQGAHPAQAA